MDIKKTLTITAIWFASFLFGIFYNTKLLITWFGNRWFRFSRHFLMFILAAILCGLLIYLIKDFIERKKKYRPLFMIVYSAVIICGLYWMRENNISNNFINGTFVLLLYPLGIASIFNLLKQKFASVTIPMIVFSMSYLAWDISGIKFMIFTALIGIIGEGITAFFFNSQNIKKWIIHCLIMFVSLSLISSFIMASSENLVYRATGFLAPKTIYEYNNLIEFITEFKWITYNPDNTFTEAINSDFACTYSHILVSLGAIPTLVIIVLQWFAIALMGIQAWNFKYSKRRYMGLMCTAIMGLHLLFAIASSFLRMPMAEFGAPFITEVGLEYCVFPLILYLYLCWSEMKNPLSDSEKVENIITLLDNSDAKLIKFVKEFCGK